METLVYTSAQWHSTSLLNKIIKAGVLCVELTNLYATLLKVGNGKDRWVDLPYIPDLNGYYTKEEINEFNVMINNKISELEADKHTHDNKEILDKITKEFTVEDKEKLDSLTPYDDRKVDQRLTALEQDSHTHSNKSVLDKTTAVFTKELEQQIIEGNEPFTPATSTTDGTQGLVPQPKAGDHIKFLRGDGNWVTVESEPYELPPATRSTLGGVKIGNNINVNANGVISVTFPPIPIASSTTLGGIKTGNGVVVDENGVLSNIGVLDVSLNQSDNTILDIEFVNETKHIQLPSGGGGSSADIVAGEGILVSHNVDSVDLPIYVESFVDGDIDTTTGVPITAPNHNILRINDFFIRVDNNRTSATVTVYDTNNVSLMWKMFFYQADGSFISVSGVNWSQNNDIITIPNNTKWIKITTKYSDDAIIETSDIGTCVIKLIGSIVDVISMQKATDELLGGVRVGDYLVTDTTGRLSVDPNLIQRIETMEEHDISDTDALILNVVE